MNRPQWRVGGFALIAVLSIGLTAASVGAQEPTPLGQAELGAIRNAVNNARAVSFWVVVSEFTGSFQDVQGQIETFTKEFSNQNLGPFLEGYHPQSVLVLYEKPGAGKKSRMAVGLTVPAHLMVKEPLRAEWIRFPSAAVTTHVGPYEQLGSVHDAILRPLQQAPQQAQDTGSPRGWPVVLLLLNNPAYVQPNEIRTEMIVPLVAVQQITAQGKEEIQQAVKAAHPVSYSIVSESFEGSVDRLGEYVKKFLQEFNGQGLGKSLASPDVRPLAILHEDPDQKKSIRIEIAFPVSKEVVVKKPLTYRKLDIPRAVTYTHQGDYSQLSLIHEEIVGAATGQAPAEAKNAGAGWPVVLRMLTNPYEVSLPTENRTEMIVPLASGQR